MQSLEIITVSSLTEMEEALSVRRRVFIEEQGVPVEIEIDEHDGDPANRNTGLHVLGRQDGRPVATGRLLLESDDRHVHIGRVAVLEEMRGQGVGRSIMRALHDLARERGFSAITLAAQTHAIGFYERLGYVAHGDIFLDAGIEHRWMDVELKAGRPLVD
jgi:predicted GNAT family N-acyltransferase